MQQTQNKSYKYYDSSSRNVQGNYTNYEVNQPEQYVKSFKTTTGEQVDVYKENLTNHIPVMSSMEKSMNFVKSGGSIGAPYYTNEPSPSPFVNATSTKTQQINTVKYSTAKPITIPVTHNKISTSYEPVDVFNGNEESTQSIQNVPTNQMHLSNYHHHHHHQFHSNNNNTNNNNTMDSIDHHGEEKTVTIKKKTIRRKKANEKLNTLRDSYIENIINQKSEQPEFESDDEIPEQIQPIKKPTVQRPISPPSPIDEFIPANKRPDNFNSPPVFEEPLQKSVKPKVNTELPLENLDKLDNKPMYRKPIPPPLDNAPKPDSSNWASSTRPITTTTSMATIPRTNKNISQKSIPDMSNQETFYQEKQATPLSTYSAHKENLRNQQMMNERSQTLRPSERRTNEMTEEIETITLQPIGKGVQDLASTISRPASRAATPRVHENSTVKSTSFFRDESSRAGNTNFNTMPSAHKLNKVQSAKNIHQMSNFDSVDSTYRRPQQQSVASKTSRRYGDASGYLTTTPLINESWHTRTESHTTAGGATSGNRFASNQHQQQGPPMSPISHQGSIISGAVIDSADYISLQQVINCEEQWYRPQFNRDEVISALKEKMPGSFIIRNSTTFSGAYGLAVKVASLPPNVTRSNDLQSDLVRHFLIETVVDDAGGQSGIRLKGFQNEPIYTSLAHLVHAHCLSPIALPIRLVLPGMMPANIGMTTSASGGVAVSNSYEYETRQREQYGGGGMSNTMQATAATSNGYNQSSSSQQHYQQQQQQQQHQQQQQQQFTQGPLTSYHRSVSTPGVNFIDPNHPNPLHQSLALTTLYLGKVDVDRLQGDSAIQHAIDKIMAKKQLKTTTVELQLDSTSGVTLIDKLQKLFYTRQFPAQHVLYAGFDPKQREFNAQILKTTGINRGRLVGVVIRKQKMIMRENVVHVFCEIDSINDLDNVVRFIGDNYLRRV